MQSCSAKERSNCACSKSSLMVISIASVVEGHGEVDALPVLVRRIAGELNGIWNVQCLPPIRRPRGKLIQGTDELEKAVELAALKCGSSGAVLVVLDSNSDCPAK